MTRPRRWEKVFFMFAPLLFGLLFITLPCQKGSARVRMRLDDNWRFHLGDIPATLQGVPITLWHWQQGENDPKDVITYSNPQLDTSTWNTATPGQDTFHGRVGYSWYRTLLPSVSYPHPMLHFDSVDDNATVYLNGKFLLHHEGWDDPFDVPLQSAWRPKGPNVLLVLVQNTAGAGGIGNTLLMPYVNQDAARGPALPSYNDSQWRVVHLPHDFVVEGNYDEHADGSHGFLPTNVAWYRKRFYIPASAKGESVWIYFEGIYRDSRFWLNGHFLGRHQSGYIGVRYDISPFVHYGAWNVLAVRVDARSAEGWWYEGGGIYRHVWLTIANPLHIVPWGVFVTSKLPSSHQALLTIQTDVTNQSKQARSVHLLSLILDATGKPIAHATSTLFVPQGQTRQIVQNISVPNPHLWSLDSPYLYTAVSRIEQGDEPLDEVKTEFGVRTIEFRADTGFYLNGKPVKLKGTCNHQDFAGVGIAMPDNLLWWRIAKLKEMGSNAYRCSHNPPSEELLTACDHLGMLVMDENRHLGDVYTPKTPHGAPYSNLSDLAAMIQRDRNHPSIIMWSMCNEEPLQGTEEGARIFAAMKKVVLSLDPTRPVTCAMNGDWGKGISNVEDLQGGNYNPGGYDWFHQHFPDKPFFASEAGSTVSDRGIYANDPQKGYVSAYDLNAPPWAQTAEDAWRPVAERPFVAGCFIWTGFDYRGEPTPYWWPCINSHFGIMDMCGFPKDNYYYYKAWWGDKPIVHILPHWNWQGQEGKPISVWCYSNADEVELFLNGQSLGKKPMPKWGHVEWSVPYRPDTLEAKAYDASGQTVATDIVETTGPAAALRLLPSTTTLPADGEEVALIEVDVVDSQGRTVPTSDNLVHFQVTGAGTIAGVGNGDPSCHQPNIADYRSAFNGKCMLIVRAGEHAGLIHVRASADGLAPAELTITTTPSAMK
ncbi:MAG TPA: beta-galactosidase GalA [Chthonomonas sp.]|uniref:beta-galactosidase GalA n=1 Tax=Chthonomonas sp. TaxID=2282153 RepID=UPI002B4B49C4|nr:beta-galactosidase GalA [Chthonomonas sp.]HLH81519.1 beta-galactosidase GalA [Chthonomonas sp.]